MHTLVASDDLLRPFLLRYDSEATRSTYGRILRSFFGPTITLDAARAVTFVDVNRYLEAGERRGLAPTTLSGQVATLRTFFGWLEALRLVPRNPASRQLVRKGRRTDPRTRPIRALTADEAARLVAAAGAAPQSGRRNRALILTLLVCALRRGEAVRMDFEHVREVGGYWILDLPETKGGPDQWVRMTGEVVHAISRLRTLYGDDGGPVWRSLKGKRKGERLAPKAVYGIVKTAAVRAGLENVSVHTLRHTACTLALEGGATLKQVQTHARHKSVETTIVYLHQRNHLADNAADYIRL